MHRYKFFLAILLSSVLVSCSDGRDENTWLVATSADNPPYEHMGNGEITGFDIDFIMAIGRHLGKNIELKNMEFHGLLAALASKNVDVVIAGMSITPERQAQVDFSIPYTNARVAVLYKKENGFGSAEDLKDKITGVQLGTIWTHIAHDLSMQYSFKTKALANNLMLVEELKNNSLSAIIMDESQADKFIAQNPELAKFSIKQYGSLFAIAMPKNSPLKKSINHAIKDLQNNGTIKALSKKWGLFGAQ